MQKKLNPQFLTLDRQGEESRGESSTYSSWLSIKTNEFMDEILSIQYDMAAKNVTSFDNPAAIE
jgi:hypothetical protein